MNTLDALGRSTGIRLRALQGYQGSTSINHLIETVRDSTNCSAKDLVACRLRRTSRNVLRGVLEEAATSRLPEEAKCICARSPSHGWSKHIANIALLVATLASHVEVQIIGVPVILVVPCV